MTFSKSFDVFEVLEVHVVPSEDGVYGSRITHYRECTVCVGYSPETFCFTSIIPSGSIVRGGEDGSSVTHRHEDTVSVGDIIEKF